MLRLQSVDTKKFTMKVGTSFVLILCALYTSATVFSKDAEIMEAYKNPKTWKALVSSFESENPDVIESQNEKSSGFASREAVKT